MPERQVGSDDEMVARYRRRQSRLYRIFRAPLPLVHNKTEAHLPECEGPKLWVGGAGRPVPAGFVNLDRQVFRGVDICGDVHSLPFKDGCFAAIECDAVLEHVEDPEAAMSELMRVLRPGGFFHVVVPFQQPFHGYPSDFQRWTQRGLQIMVEKANCEVISEGIRTGPTATLLTYFCEYCRILAPAKFGKAAYAAANWAVWPLRYLDLALNRKPNAHILANSIYILARKREDGPRNETSGRRDHP